MSTLARLGSQLEFQSHTPNGQRTCDGETSPLQDDKVKYYVHIEFLEYGEDYMIQPDATALKRQGFRL